MCGAERVVNWKVGMDGGGMTGGFRWRLPRCVTVYDRIGNGIVSFSEGVGI